MRFNPIKHEKRGIDEEREAGWETAATLWYTSTLSDVDLLRYKAWTRTHCDGRVLIGTDRIAFELDADAMSFLLTWNE